MELKKMELNELLSYDFGSDEAYEYAGALATSIGMFVNCYGGEKKFKDLVDGLNTAALHRFNLVATMIFLELAYDWRTSGCDYWDERKKESMKFAYRNEFFFLDRFKELTGFELPLKTDDSPYKNLHFSHVLDYKVFNDKGQVWLTHFASYWINEHSTLKQNFCRNYVFTVLKPNYPDVDFGKIYFPFI